MTWLFWLMIAAIVVAFAGVTGIKPRNGRHIAHTSLMGVARIVLVLLIVVVLYATLRSHWGG